MAIFSLCQSVWRHVQENELAVRYREDSDFALYIKILNALAYVLSESVISAFEQLLETKFYITNETILLPLIEYLEDAWILWLNR